VEVRHGDSPLAIAAGKQRALLAILLLHANHTVGRERIVDDLWGEDVPSSARKMVQVYVSQLRKALPEPRLHTRGSGYVLEVGRDELDVDRFRRLAAEGGSALSDGDAAGAAELLREALALWRGPALAGLSEPFAEHEGAHLEELRLVALEQRIAADLGLGRGAELVAELEPLVARYPLRERLREQHMLALYRAGRQADALASYQAYRRTIVDDLGIEPSPALQELQRRMLRHDPALGRRDPAGASAVAPTQASSSSPRASAGVDVRYARSGDVRIAYQLVGEGPLDLILVHGWVCTFEPGWENRKIARFYQRLASLGRLVLFDKRGTGLSDRVSPERLPDLETRMDDVRAVLDAVGSERAVVLGVSEGGSMSALFAATHPERTLGLVLMGAFARSMWAPDHPFGVSDDEYRRRLAVLDDDDWAHSAVVEWLGRVGPEILRDEEAVRWYVSYLIRGASPAANRAIRIMNRDIDIRGVLPTIAVPTLVLLRAEEHYGDRTRYLGEHIPGARVAALPGTDHLPWEGDQDALLAEIEHFVAGLEDEIASDRYLATLVFTDIVGSTAKAAELGDRQWQDLLSRHFEVVRSQLARFRGREIDTTGDGLFASFDGPARAIRCAAAMVEAMRTLGLQIRVGVHTGEIQQQDGAPKGIAVHIASRIMAAAQPGEVLVSSTVKDLVAGSGLAFEDRGERALKGVPDRWRVYAATD
jgi:DNA-binding SARP family transcriptional activator/class 3 adenylate cyclase/alpha-beta hydrolase superfamily lysophospholipase